MEPKETIPCIPVVPMRTWMALTEAIPDFKEKFCAVLPETSASMVFTFEPVVKVMNEAYGVQIQATLVTTGEFVYEIWKRRSEDRWDVVDRKRGTPPFTAYREAMEKAIERAIELKLFGK